MTGFDARVFVVDDDHSVRTALRRLMRSVKLPVETFASAREFLDRIPPDTPGCLVLDMRMPDMSGLELKDELSARGQHLPTIFITAHPHAALRERAMKAGAVEFLEKPFDDQALLDAIYRAVEGTKEA